MKKTLSFLLGIIIVWAICTVALYLPGRMSFVNALFIAFGVTILGIFSPIAVAWVRKIINK